MPKALTQAEIDEGRHDIAARLAQASQTEAREFMLPVRAVAYFFPRLTEAERAQPVWPGARLPEEGGSTDAFPPLDLKGLQNWLKENGAGFRVEPNVEGDFPGAQMIFVKD